MMKGYLLGIIAALLLIANAGVGLRCLVNSFNSFHDSSVDYKGRNKRALMTLVIINCFSGFAVVIGYYFT